MNIQYQNQNKIKLLITGGNGDLAEKIKNLLNNSLFDVYTPNKEELDVTSIDSVDCFFHKKKFDIVINLAGTLYSSDIIDSEPSKWINDINVNLIGTYLVSRAALLANEKTQLINVSSTAGFNFYSDWTSYCASKSGVLSLSGGIYKSGYNIITVCPGAIQTKLRNNISIVNNNIMTIDEGVIPIIDSIYNKFKSGDVIFYRKNELKIFRYDDMGM